MMRSLVSAPLTNLVCMRLLYCTYRYTTAPVTFQNWPHAGSHFVLDFCFARHYKLALLGRRADLPGYTLMLGHVRTRVIVPIGPEDGSTTSTPEQLIRARK